MKAQHPDELYVLSAGAAQGLVEAVAPRFAARTGIALRPTFGAVGAIREKLLAGERCDALILTQAMIEQLAAAGHVVAGTQAVLGRVRTGIGVRDGDALPDVTTRAALERSLCAATEIFLPDMQRSTAGIHFVRVLEQLGILTEVAPRLMAYPNGAAAMHAMAQNTGSTPIGCTQMSEIRYTKGVTPVGPLPMEFELATAYSIAVCSAAQRQAVAVDFAEWLGGPEQGGTRGEMGFEV